MPVRLFAFPGGVNPDEPAGGYETEPPPTRGSFGAGLPAAC